MFTAREWLNDELPPATTVAGLSTMAWQQYRAAAAVGALKRVPANFKKLPNGSPAVGERAEARILIIVHEVQTHLLDAETDRVPCRSPSR